MKTLQTYFRLSLISIAFIAFTACDNSKSSGGDDDVNYYAISHNDCSDKTSPAQGETTFCVHEVVRVTPHMGDCNKYNVGDKVCINCPNGDCPATTRFTTDDGVWLRACIVETRVIDNECKDLWPRGTCKYYVTLTKLNP